jgi:hypothetical protein
MAPETQGEWRQTSCKDPDTGTRVGVMQFSARAQRKPSHKDNVHRRKERDVQILAALDADVPIKDVASQFSLSVGKVYSIATENGKPLRKGRNSSAFRHPFPSSASGVL